MSAIMGLKCLYSSCYFLALLVSGQINIAPSYVRTAHTDQSIGEAHRPRVIARIICLQHLENDYNIFIYMLQ